jgi:hypothetical protein
MSPHAEKIHALAREVNALFSRPDMVALFAHIPADRIAQLHDFVRHCDERTGRLSEELLAHYAVQLEAAVEVMRRIVAEYDHERLKSLPIDRLGRA